jgi:hypothetical protein
MLALVHDLHARLSAALAVPVLRPAQARDPHQAAPLDGQGRPMIGGGERGLGAYLQQHPDGYVQIEDPQAIGVLGVSEIFWCPVGCVALTPEGSDALARRVLLTLCGIPGRDPGYYVLVLPDTTRALAPDLYLTRPTVTRPVIGGQL